MRSTVDSVSGNARASAWKVLIGLNMIPPDVVGPTEPPGHSRDESLALTQDGLEPLAVSLHRGARAAQRGGHVLVSHLGAGLGEVGQRGEDLPRPSTDLLRQQPQIHPLLGVLVLGLL